MLSSKCNIILHLHDRTGRLENAFNPIAPSTTLHDRTGRLENDGRTGIRCVKLHDRTGRLESTFNPMAPTAVLHDRTGRLEKC